MYQNDYLTYRVTSAETERATRLAERRRMIEEHADRIVPRQGLLSRIVRAIAPRSVSQHATSQRSASQHATARTASPAAPRARRVAETACPAGARCALNDA